MKKILLSKKIIFPIVILYIVLLILFLFKSLTIKNKLVSNPLVVTISPTPTLTPTPTQIPPTIKYVLPNSDFSGLRQTITPKGEIREIIGRVISYSTEINKLRIGDEAIPFVFDLNISTGEALLVDEVSINEKGIAVYIPSDTSKIKPGITIISDCPDEKVDPGCSTISRVHIIKEGK